MGARLNPRGDRLDLEPARTNNASAPVPRLTTPTLRATACTGPTSSNQATAEVAEALLEDIPEAIERGLSAIRAEAPDYFALADHDPVFVDLSRRAYGDHLKALWTGLRDGSESVLYAPPPFVIGEASQCADLGISIGTMLHNLRLSHRLMMNELMDRAECVVADDALRTKVLRRGHEWLFRYFDWIAAEVTAAHQRARDARFRGRERRRQQLILRILRGEKAVDGGELAYPLSHQHVGVVAWGSHAEEGIRSLSERTGAAILIMGNTNDVAWGWLGAASLELPKARVVARCLADGTRIALGSVQRATDGFRVTHRQVVEAWRVARCTDARVTCFRDVEVLALMTHDTKMACDFVQHQLGPLGGDDARSQLLRETMRTYFDVGMNAVAAAALLKVNDRTVAYRVKRVERLLGESIRTRRNELSLALRLRELLPAMTGPAPRSPLYDIDAAAATPIS